MTMTRRGALMGLALIPFGASLRAEPRARDDDDRLRQLERTAQGRLGVAILDTQSGTRIFHRGDERFPMCSTFKLLAVAAVLARVDAGAERLDRPVSFSKSDLLEYAPATTARVSTGSMTMAELCDAAMTVSDNTAANLILATIGGPAGLTKYTRSLGDSVTRLDRIEPDLNEARPGDPRDITTPSAMLGNLRQLLAGTALSAASRERLTTWLIANKTGNARLRAGVPAEWRVGDKTGTGNRGTANDVGILWPPRRAPILVAAYLTEAEAPAAVRDSTLAEIARIAVRMQSDH